MSYRVKRRRELTGIGAAPVYSWTGIKIDQPDLCARAAIALVHALDKKQQAGEKVPRVIVITSMGLGDQHDKLPFVMRVSVFPISDLYLRTCLAHHRLSSFDLRCLVKSSRRTC
jgi:hypothetical protein